MKRESYFCYVPKNTSYEIDVHHSNGLCKAADVFVVACICHVFLGFIEYAFVLLGFGKTKFVNALVQTDSVNDYDNRTNQTKNIEANFEIGFSENPHNQLIITLYIIS